MSKKRRERWISNTHLVRYSTVSYTLQWAMQLVTYSVLSLSFLQVILFSCYLSSPSPSVFPLPLSTFISPPVLLSSPVFHVYISSISSPIYFPCLLSSFVPFSLAFHFFSYCCQFLLRLLATFHTLSLGFSHPFH